MTPKIDDVAPISMDQYVYDMIKPAAHVRKELRKVPREAVCSVVSLRVRRNICEKVVSQGREKNIQHV